MKNRIINTGRLLIMITILIGISTCDVEKKLIQQEKDAIAEFLRINNITVGPTASGLYYIETQEGTGVQPVPGDTAALYFTVYLINGMKIGELITGDPFKFRLGTDAVIPGFEEGIGMMKTGGKAQLLIPSSLAYGSEGDGFVIPPYSPLVYYVELKQIIPGPLEK
ncbi:MAG: FKBP-type peptidyl-prolyl cis-trans isomerase [Bacteroidales bacterium]|jgi:FKBP-type peptidyl-prolyl cis-trans isomerase|nr:FKBP-type peptidyl-prolyl cis-trans isomerase [Bacteroidales bacterium]